MAQTPVWKTVLNTALVGTARQPFAVPAEEGQLGQMLAGLKSDNGEFDLLGAAGAIALHQKVGQLPAKLDLEMPDPCPANSQAACSQAAASYLGRMLGGEQQSCLPEWLELARDRDLRVPDYYLPDLLELGQRKSELREAIAPVLGTRGRWLAAQNPAWNYAAAGIREDAFEIWETGTIAARLATLRAWRSRDPEAARQALDKTWKQDAAGDRAKFLGALEVNLSLDDEPFLALALGDRSKQVRPVAAQLLGELPTSQLSQRMAERAATWLTLTDGQLVLNVPDSLSADLLADGVREERRERGKKASWFFQVVKFVPPQRWSEAFSRSPRELIQLALQTDWAELVIRTWTAAAQQYGDRDWAEALLSLATDDTVGHVVMPCFEIVPMSKREAIALEVLHSAGAAIAIERVLLACKFPWSEALARAAIAACRRLMKQGKTNAYSGEQVLMACARQAPPSFIDDPVVVEVWEMGTDDAHNTYKQRAIAKFRDLLGFRCAMTHAFHADR